MESSGDLVGRVIANKYAVQSVIGQGAMGVVYRAKQIALDKTIALKVLGSELRDDPEFVLRFHTEARAASRLDHPNSTRVLDFGEEPDGLLYIAMELLQGRTLADLLEQEYPLAPARIASIMSQTLSAVGAAHALKVLHRDLKPENIVILEARDDEDRRVDVVKVCDFGIAKLEGVAEPSEHTASRASILDVKVPATPKLRSATRAGVIMGTPQYMSPEQARGEKLDPRSDLYSLGIVLYEMLTSRAPFDEGTAADVLYSHASVDPPPPSMLADHIDPQLEAICLRALRKDPNERFASAREMRLALRPLLDDFGAERRSLRNGVLEGHRPSNEKDSTPALPPVSRDPAASAPTISATAVGPRPKRSAWVLWAIPALAVAIGAGTYAMTARRARVSSTRVEAPAPTMKVASTAEPAPTQTQTPTQAPTQAPTLTLAPTQTSTPTRTHHRVASVQPRDPVPTADPDPPPPPTTPLAPPPPPLVTATVAATVAPPPPPAVHADPARVHVDLGPIQADRVNATSVETALRHVDFTSCYRAEVAQLHEAEGPATLAIDMDEERVTHADLVGGAFTPSLRRCVAQHALGTRVRNADTGAATAKVTLRFALR